MKLLLKAELLRRNISATKQLKRGNSMEEILQKAKRLAGDLEPWPDYFESKTREFKAVLNFFDFNNRASILEIGCGNGFAAALLSKRSASVTALDLPEKNARSHSIGIKSAEELMRRLDIRNVRVMGGSAEELPFSDASFDFIFSGFALQYVTRKGRALQEMRRVLCPGGVIVAIVPNFTERLALPIVKCEYALKRLLYYLTKSIQRAHKEAASQTTAGAVRDRALNSKAACDWFSLRPDGAYKSFLEEMMRHTPFSWKRLFRQHGFRITRTFSTELLPLGIFDIAGSAVRHFISAKSFYLNKALGGVPIIRDLGHTLCVVSTKDREKVS